MFFLIFFLLQLCYFFTFGPEIVALEILIYQNLSQILQEFIVVFISNIFPCFCFYFNKDKIIMVLTQKKKVAPLSTLRPD